MASIAASVAPFRDPSRPPTPPKEKAMPLKLGREVSSTNSARPRLPDTPDDSPSSSAEDFKATSSRSRKKVAWHQVVNGTSGSSPKGHRPLRPSRECRSTKSILKVAHENNGTRLGLGLDSTSLQSTLRSANEHLATDSRSSSLDAYNTLLACVSTYEDTSKVEDVLAPMAELCRYIRRDILLKPMAETPSDLHLAPTAVKIATAFLGSPLFANVVPEEFKAFIIEQSIHKLEDARTTQVLLSHYLCMLEKSRWGPKVMNADRTQRLLVGLERLGPRGKNLRIVCHRLMIYKHLLFYAKAIMSSKVEVWLHHLFSGLLSSVKDVRSRAIACGIEAGLQIGGVSNVSRCCLEVLNQKGPKDERIIDILHARAIAVLESKEEPIQIPPTWSILLLLQRSRRSRLETWEHFQLWKDIMSRCLESADIQTKHQAHLAINRLMYSIHIDAITPSMAAFLQQLLQKQLIPPIPPAVNEKKVVISKQSARSTYCVVLFYAFHPSASHAQLDLCWERLLDGVLVPALLHTKGDTSFGCEVVTSLLSNDGAPRVWDEKKANSHGPILATELPALDPKWVRSRALKIFNTLDTLSTKIDQRDKHLLQPIWNHFVAAVGSACSKEVRVSNDTLTFLAGLLNQAQRQFVRALEFSQRTIEAEFLQQLVDNLASKIGILPLSERRILRDEDGFFHVSSDSPAHRSQHASSQGRSTTECLLRLSLDAAQEDPGEGLPNLLQKIISIIVPTSHSRRVRIEVLKDLIRLCERGSTGSWSHGAATLWQIVAKHLFSILEEPKSSERQSSSSTLAQESRDIVKVLEMGLQISSDDDVSIWGRLYDKLVEAALADLGISAVNSVIIEPIVHRILRQSEHQMDCHTLQHVQRLLKSTHWPKVRHAHESTLAQLSDPAKKQKIGPEAGLGDDIYHLAERTLKSTYSHTRSLPKQLMENSLSAIDHLIRTCPTSYLGMLFDRLQNGLRIWIQDSDNLASPTDNGFLSKISHFWSFFQHFIQEATESSRESLLSRLSPLITAGLQSSHEDIRNEAVELWNGSFGCLSTPKYSEELEKALLRIKKVADIDTPGLPESLTVSEQASQHVLTDPSLPERHPANSNSEESALRLTKRSNLPLLANSGRVVKSSPSKGSNHTASRLRKQGKTTPKARLRHDDSQIDFAAVDSSPTAFDDADPEMLTDRQKEMLERQKQGAALFPELSSPGSINAVPSPLRLPKFALRAREVTQPILDLDEDTGIAFATEDLMQRVLGSSPTPSSSRHRSEELRLDDEIPSSPPIVSMHQLGQQVSADAPTPILTDSDDLAGPIIENSPAAESARLPENSEESAKEMSSPQTLHGRSAGGHSIPRSEIHDSVDGPQNPHSDFGAGNNTPHNQVSQLVADAHEAYQAGLPRSEDVRSARTRSPEFGLDDGEQANHVTGSRERSTVDDIQSEQVDAQLLSEMHNHPTPSNQAMRGGRKRNRTRDTSPRARKRLARESQVTAADADQTNGEIEADCVLIESRPATGPFQSVSPEKEVTIKQEHPESPARIHESREPAALVTRSRSRQSQDTGALPASGSRSSMGGKASRKHVQVKRERTEDGPGSQLQHIAQIRAGEKAAPGSQSSQGMPEAIDVTIYDSGERSRRPGRRRTSKAGKAGSADVSQERGYLEEVRRILGRREQMHLSSDGEGKLREMLLKTSFESQRAANESA